MPELPEVETTTNGIKPWLVGREIAEVNIQNKSLRWPIPENIGNYQGKKVVEVFRRAKYILIKVDDGEHLLLHLGMSGSIRICSQKERRIKHDHVEFIMSDGAIMRFNDPRRFGCLLEAGTDPLQHKLLASLGPEPLEDGFDGKYLKNLSANKQKMIKNFIMDNHVVVGVGNIYASESLFLAGIRPDCKASKVSLARYKLLATTIKKVLSKAIEAGGTTLNDFLQSDGKPGYFAQQLNVYGRKDESCFVCQTKVKKIVIGQRASYFCSKCQR